MERLAILHALEYKVEGAETAHLLLTLLYDDCLSRGRSLVTGGARHLGGIIESVGVVNAADSLTAIKFLVYESGAITLERLLEALDADFQGYEKERRMLLAARNTEMTTRWQTRWWPRYRAI